jgi:hypothetical protein
MKLIRYIELYAVVCVSSLAFGVEPSPPNPSAVSASDPSLPVSVSAFPVFELKPMEYRIPLNGGMPVASDEMPANIIDGHLVYLAKGQFYVADSGQITSSSSAQTARSTPWMTLTELSYAYRSGDKERMKSLYAPDAKSALAEALDGPQTGPAMMHYVAGVTSIKVLAAFEKPVGIVALVEITERAGKSIAPYVFTKVAGQYLTSSATVSTADLFNLIACLNGNSIEGLKVMEAK